MAMAGVVRQIIMQETTLPRAWPLLLLCPLFLVLVTHYWYTAAKQKRNSGGRLRIPSPPALPVVGHLHLVGALPHVSFRDLAREHGPDVMLLRLGAVSTLVVSSPRAAEDVLRARDHLLASRPRSVVTDVLMYGSSDVAFAPYGDRWRQARKLVTTHMLSVKKVRSFRAAAAEEVSMVMEKISEAATAGATVDMSELFNSSLVDMACRLVSGNFFRKEGRSKMFRALVDDTSRLLGGFNMEEFFPALARTGVLTRGVRAKAERVRNRWADLLDKVIDRHESKDHHSPCGDDKDHRDFVHVLLSVKHEYGLTRDHMKALLTDVFFGSIDTTSRTLDFTFAELMRKPALTRKLQAEVRSIVPQGQESVSDADINNMPYLRAVIKESIRLHPVAPLLAPHLAMAECCINGFVVPPGMRVVVNVWAIGRDSSSWGEDAEEFVPERFLDDGGAASVTFRGNDFQFLTFGSGRRMCPGINFAMASMELLLANLMYKFDWELPAGLDEDGIDMAEEFGITVRRKEKLLLIPKSHV